MERLVNVTKMGVLAPVFLLLNWLDAFLTTLAWNTDKFSELNPIWAWTFRNLPLWSNWVIKMGLAVTCIFVLLHFYPRYPHSVKRILTALVIAMGMVCVVNAIAVII